MTVKNNLRPGYKQTDVGMIPEDWQRVTVMDLASRKPNSIVGGPFGSDLVSNDYVLYGVPVIRGQNMAGHVVSGEFVFVSPKKTKYLKANTAAPRDIVFTQRGTLGQVALVPENGFDTYVVSQSQMKLSIDLRSYDPEYLLQFFISGPGQKQILESAIQTGVPHTNLAILKAYKLAVPPLPEQRAIAAVLRDVDALLGGLGRLIAKKRDLKQAVMQQLLTGQTRLPGFHGEWETVRLADVSAFITKGSTPTTYGFGWQSSGVLFLRSECVSPEGLDLAESMFISAEAHRVLRRSAVRPNDLLITITGNVGRVVRLPGDFGEANINQHIARIRIVDEATHPGWVYHFLSQPGVRQHFEKITTGQAYPQISLAQVRDAVIPRPAIGEQREISTALDDMDREITVLEVRRDKTRALKQAMMQELLTGKTRLVPTGGTHA